MKEPVYSVEDLTMEDLYPHFRTGQSYFIFGSGRNKNYGYRTGIMTPIGDIEIGQWKKLVQEIMKRENEEELYSNLLNWVREHIPWLRHVRDIQEYAMELYACRIFDDPKWCDYLAFNQKYRPEIFQKEEEAQ